jgi:hypothetical protein
MYCLADADLEVLGNVEERLKIVDVKSREHDWFEKQKNT